MSVTDAITALRDIADELNTVSSALVDIERQLEPVEEEYQRFLRDFETGLWQKHVDRGDKLPSERLREQLAHRAMPPELYGRYFALQKARKRAEKRIGALKVAADAQRSVLSALKVEMEATA